MNKYFLAILLSTSIVIFSCNSDKSSETDNIACFYEFDKSSTVNLKWTAYKTSEKVAVGGTFNDVLVKAGEKSTKLTEVLNTIAFTILTNSTNTTNPDRDQKIVSSFFGAMTGTDIIMGQVSKVEGDNEKGTCSFFVTMNGIEKEVILTYTVTENIVKMVGELDLNNWNGNDAIASLNKVCEDLHKGADGVSVLWPNIGIEIEAALSKRCH